MTTAAIPRLVVGLLAASALVACGSGSATEQVLAPAQTTTQPPAWTTYYDQEGGFSKAFAPGAIELINWRAGAETLTETGGPLFSSRMRAVSVRGVGLFGAV